MVKESIRNQQKDILMWHTYSEPKCWSSCCSWYSTNLIIIQRQYTDTSSWKRHSRNWKQSDSYSDFCKCTQCENPSDSRAGLLQTVSYCRLNSLTAEITDHHTSSAWPLSKYCSLNDTIWITITEYEAALFYASKQQPLNNFGTKSFWKCKITVFVCVFGDKHINIFRPAQSHRKQKVKRPTPETHSETEQRETEDELHDASGWWRGH